MNYNFKDTTPHQNEPMADDNYYTDFTELDKSIEYSLTELSELIKTKGNGKAVRDIFSLAFKLIEQIDGIEDYHNEKYEEYYRQFTDVLKELSEDKDYHSLPEIAGARGGFDTLGERLNNTTAQLAQTVSHTELDAQLATLLDGGPSIFMDSLAMLQSTYPNGASGVALVRETDPARIYVWDGSVWKDFGEYQGVKPKDDSIEVSMLNVDTKDYVQGYNNSGVNIEYLDNRRVHRVHETNLQGNYISLSTLEYTEDGKLSSVVEIRDGREFKQTFTYNVNGEFAGALNEVKEAF